MSNPSNYESTELNNYTVLDFKGRYDNVDKWFLMGSPFPVLLTTISYLIIVTKIGPNYMNRRTPYNLNTVLILYNVAQVVLSMHMFQIGFRYHWNYGLIGASCITESKEGLKFITEASYLYMMAKLTELLDTIFFVLRKKQNQVTFLHVYHHTFMLLSTWVVLKYDPSDTPFFLGTLNSFVHVIMYGYYALSAIPHIAPYLWWKKYITMLQLIQFVAVIIQILVKYHATKCPPSKIFVGIIVLNAMLFIYLFIKFYVDAFMVNKSKEKNTKSNLIDTRKVKKNN